MRDRLKQILDCVKDGMIKKYVFKWRLIEV